MSGAGRGGMVWTANDAERERFRFGDEPGKIVCHDEQKRCGVSDRIASLTGRASETRMILKSIAEALDGDVPARPSPDGTLPPPTVMRQLDELGDEIDGALEMARRIRALI